jgi:hypothetical protein
MGAHAVSAVRLVPSSDAVAELAPYSYVISDPGDLYEHRNTFFPNWRIWIRKQPNARDPWFDSASSSNGNDTQRCCVDITVGRPVSVQELCQLLGTRVCWQGNAASYFSPARSIGRVIAEGTGSVCEAPGYPRPRPLQLDTSGNTVRFAYRAGNQWRKDWGTMIRLDNLFIRGSRQLRLARHARPDS